ncbi:hypothetical protein DFH07DRAFT_815797 [Mycena maculata]|uniref:F-box domain-containing protein n=1 Tax=Mycena maculata TaxID=230809 RepID=A0AAD7JBP1_9AGAR|nr:hypothetical protein DFH07DRAFT_815797 [Mycena maculata]
MAQSRGFPSSIPLPPSHDLRRLLTSNEVPLDSEIPFITQAISKEQAQVDVLNAQIRRRSGPHSTGPPHLVQQRNEIAEDVRRHQAILSAIRHIPPELLCHIFSLATSATGRIGEDIVDIPPWDIIHVCRSWRQTALSYPVLWSVIEISPYTAFSTDMIEAQLSWSGDTPLAIYQWGGIGDPKDVDPRLLDLVVAQCSRWRILHLKQIPDANFDWIRQTRGNLPSLEVLEVLAPNATVPDIFSNATSLRRVTLCEQNFQCSSPSLILPWGQITHYRGSHSAQRQLEILNVMPNLRQCSIRYSFRNGNLAGQEALLPHLYSLILQGDEFLLHLKTPLLQDLVLHKAQLETVLPFIHKSSCILTKLRLTSFTLSPKLVPVLEALPALTHLLIETAGEKDQSQADVFHAMKISNTSSDLCRNLESLFYGYPHRDNFPWDAFFAMAYSRTGRLAWLRLFDVFDEYPMNDVEPGLQMLREEGIDAAFLPKTAHLVAYAKEGL